MHPLYEGLQRIPWWVWFLFGNLVSFVITSWALSGHAKENEIAKQRLEMTVRELRDEVQKANKLLEFGQ